jgi:hypothetical protein
MEEARKKADLAKRKTHYTLSTTKLEIRAK